MSKKTLFLIDGSALAYRSFFALIRNPLINSRGENTSAIFGFCRFLFKILDEEKPDYWAVVFDPPGPTFRHEQYKEYKATRQKMPDDMRSQIPKIHEAVHALNIPLIEYPGYEADDVIGTLARKAQQNGLETYMVSGDKDFMQLIDHSIKMYNPKRAGEEIEILDQKGVEEKVGLPPSKIIDYLGLMGDTSDNVPGVQGVGKKTAVKLIQEFGSLEEVLENAEKVSRANVRQSLMESKEIALLSKKLVTIETAVPLEIEIESLVRQEHDQEKAVELFKELEFTSLLNRFTTKQKISQVEYKIIHTKDKLTELVRKLRQSEAFVVDLETTDKNPMRAEIVGIAFSVKPLEAFYVPVKVQKSGSTAAGREMILEEEGELFGALSVSKLPISSVFVNLKGHFYAHQNITIAISDVSSLQIHL